MWAALALTLVSALAGCAMPGAQRGGATVHVTPSPSPSPSVTATPVPCNPATQWPPPTNHVDLEAIALAPSKTGPATGWATGKLLPGLTQGNFTPTAVLYHLINGQWQRAPQTYPGADLMTIAMGGPTDGWAASSTPLTGSAHPLVLHDTNGVWRPVDIPALDFILQPTATILEANIFSVKIQLFGPDVGWMVAQTNYPRPDGGPLTLILRYDGHAWSTLPTPTVPSTMTLFDVSAVSANELWMVGTDYGAASETTRFFHYVHQQWQRAKQTFPLITQSLTMASPTLGWAGDNDGDSSVPNQLLWYHNQQWAPFPIPSALTQHGAYPLGPILTPAPGVVWMETEQLSTQTPGLWQEAQNRWSPVPWPYTDIIPTALTQDTTGTLWGIANIGHQQNCPPNLVYEVWQGVFLRQTHGHWTRQNLP